MPFTLPLREVPSFPAAHSKIVNANGTPSTEFLTFLRELEAYLQRERAALDEIEATTFP